MQKRAPKGKCRHRDPFKNINLGKHPAVEKNFRGVPPTRQVSSSLVEKWKKNPRTREKSGAKEKCSTGQVASRFTKEQGEEGPEFKSSQKKQTQASFFPCTSAKQNLGTSLSITKCPRFQGVLWACVWGWPQDPIPPVPEVRDPKKPDKIPRISPHWGPTLGGQPCGFIYWVHAF
ncbi:hypothetical protein GWK47_013955 [Chionoecetes opilio]|uniref:Uncharacterized protein n=1 Tax=Chionoecetes opilio TaxID=41210 RepID=A0A8J5C0X3_CHIOP|nr:hypothetical protein GWK47_013955 [Chionoecetes opilio]